MTVYVLLDMDGKYQVTDEPWDKVQKLPRKQVKKFKTKEAAEAFVAAGGFDAEPQQKAVKNTKGGDKIVFNDEAEDAIIYVDGSFQKKPKDLGDNGCGAYGLIIFFRNENTIISETGKLIDKDPESQKLNGTGKFISERYSWEEKNGVITKSEKKVVENNFTVKKIGDTTDSKKRGIIATGWASAGEFLGAARGIELCVAHGCSNIVICHDAADIKDASKKVINAYEKSGTKDSLLEDLKAGTDSNTSYYFRGILLKALQGKLEVGKKEGGLKVKACNYIAAHSRSDGETMYGELDGVYNDMVDILAKVQMIKNPICKDERLVDQNPNLTKFLRGDSNNLDTLHMMQNNEEEPDRSKFIDGAWKVLEDVLKKGKPQFS